MNYHAVMKRLFPVYILILFSHHMLSQNVIRISGDLTCTPLQEDVFLITHYFPRFGSNSLFVALPGHKGVLIDTPHESTGTCALLGWIDSTFVETKLVAINTGWHQDNLGGNEYLRSKGIDIYGPDRTAELIIKRGDELKSLLLESTRDLEDQHYYESYLQLNLVAPNKLFPIEEGFRLKFGDEVFEVFFPGESHTVDNTVVYLHKRQILFGGCMMLSMQTSRPGFIEHANMEAWPESIKRVGKRFPEAIVVIPGHGQPGDTSLYRHTIDVLNQYSQGK
jgi:metallo-beta-lactamase class B